MKIEVGKYYKTRNGKKAFVWGILPPSEKHTYPVRAVCGEKRVSYTLAGHHLEEKDNVFDLVEEWKEPESLTCLLYLYRDKRNDSLGWGVTRNAEYTHDCLVAKKLVTLTEGEGM